MSDWTKERITDTVREVIMNELGRDGLPDLNHDIQNDLGADSLDCMELIMAFEEEFGIEIPDADEEDLFNRDGGFTVQAAIDYVSGRLNA